MLKNYILITFRNLQRNTLYSFVNIAGLSIGLACSILILLWVANEVTYDAFHANYKQIYQAHINQDISGNIETSPNTPYPLMDALTNKSSQIKHAALVNHGEGYLLAAGENKVSKMGTVATENFLAMFSFKLINGNSKHALSDPTSIVLTQATAKALFGDGDALNKIVTLENKHELKVSGVIEDVPSQSTLQFDFLLPISFYQATQPWMQRAMTDWRSNSFKVFVELSPNASTAEVSEAIKDLVKTNSDYSPTAQVVLHPMEQWHLYTEFTNGKASGGMIEFVRMFTAIGMFILVVACINFMNLATARSESRAREVGIRKSVGSRRKQLIVQFLGESMVITIIAFLFALVIVEVSLPFYNTLINKTLSINYSNPWLWLSAAGIILTTGFISGSYPAFYLSSFQPVQVLKGKIQAGKHSVTPRKILVTAQFGFSIFLIIGTLVIYQQISHVKARHIGYDRENLMLIWTTAEIEQNFESLREQLKSSGVVKSVCKSSAPITRIFSGTDDVSWPGKINNDKVGFTTMATEYDFTETMGIKMLEGRDFSRDFKSDSSGIIINKSALDLMGLKDPIGQKINIWGDDRTILGVMDDVVMGSPYHSVGPLALVLIPGWSSTISVRLLPTNDVPGAVSQVESVFKTFDPEHPLWYRFADDEFETKYTSIKLVSRLAWIFAILAVLISCLGLFGLAAFTAQQRTKEVGIRKILGASVSSLVMLISKDFSKLVIAAFLIAAPMAWWMLDGFLDQYPYRVTLQWWILPLAGMVTLILTISIVSTQALQAARTNPSDSLRNE
jgi:ABC-type antimicrobial peptide transport system permease subunit